MCRSHYFLFTFIFLFYSCSENPKLEKQRKIDKAAEDLFTELKPQMEKIENLFENLKNFSDYMNSKEVKEYIEAVELASRPNLQELSKLVPEKFRYQLPNKSKNFLRVEELLKQVDQAKHNLDSLYEEVIKHEDYLKFESAVQTEIKISKEISELIDEDFEWYYKSLMGNFPGLGKLRYVAKALKYSALISAERGKFKETKEFLILLNTFVSKLEKSKGPLILKLVAYALHNINYSTITDLIASNVLDFNQLKEIQVIFENYDYPEKSDLAFVISGELQMHLQFCAASKVGGNEYILLQIYPMTFLDDNPEDTLKWYKQELENNNIFKHDEYLKSIINFFTALSEDFKNWSIPEKMKSAKILNSIISESSKTLESEFTKLFFKPYPKIVRKRNVVWTRYETCKLILAIKLFENENNTLPENISQLLGKYLDEIPVDYNTGEPIKYIKTQRVIKVETSSGGELELKF